MAAEGLIPALALLSIVGLIAIVIPKRLVDPDDALFVVVITSILSLLLMVLAAKYDMLLYVFVGAGVLMALFAYSAVLAERSSKST